jgi:hypothetical protein
MRSRVQIMAAALLICLAGPVRAVESELKQQFSGWFSLNNDQPSTPRFGLRYLPTLSLAMVTGAVWKLDSELSLDASASAAAPGWRDLGVSGRIKPYRLWLRVSSARFEARLGLQKINFGSAALFRPLMWFDSLDPRDPLQVTSGVYGLLLRYYFKNNANVWLWGLYGNSAAKGWETQATARHAPEFGGRFQAPLFSGEAGLTVHQRQLDPGDAAAAARPTERRFAVDGKWDLGIGLWAEASFIHQDGPARPWPWQRALSLGVDYTFNVGNGLYLLAEQFLSQGAEALFSTGAGSISFSALLARYPLGLLDSLSAIFYYDWRLNQSYSMADWQRTTDRWQFHLMVFWNPRRTQASQGPSANSMFGGKGFQLLVVWNI